MTGVRQDLSDIVLILTTTPDGDLGNRIARALVDERLAACVNVHAPMTSVYRWDGKVEHAVECQLVIKTTREKVEGVRTRVIQLHSYELPELVVLAVIDGSPAYLDWVRAESR